MKKWLTVPAVILFVLLLPVLIPYGVISNVLFRRRLKRAVERSQCPTCGSGLGEQALKLADEQWREYVSCLRRQNPGVRFRLVRLVHAICASCGASLQFVEHTRLFETTKPIPQLVEDSHEHRS